MNDKIVDKLEKLAEKLGTTIEHLWGVLVKQAPINAYCEIAYILLYLILFVVCFKLTLYLAKKTNWTSEEATDTVYGVSSILFGIVTIVTLFFFLGNIQNLSMIMAGIFNPEYWAFKQLPI